MFDFLRIFFLLLVGLHIFSVEPYCPEDVCAENKPSVDANGKILLTIYYDNDNPNNFEQPNTNMVSQACGALNTFPASNIDIDLVVGAGSVRDDNNKLVAKNDVEADRRDGCAAKLLNDPSKFNSYACCKSSGGSSKYKDCALEQGVSESALDTCVQNHESDELLMANGDRRTKAKIDDCHLPEFAINNVVDRCIKIPTFHELLSALCEIFNRGSSNMDICLS